MFERVTTRSRKRNMPALNIPFKITKKVILSKKFKMSKPWLIITEKNYARHL